MASSRRSSTWCSGEWGHDTHRDREERTSANLSCPSDIEPRTTRLNIIDVVSILPFYIHLALKGK